MPTLIMAEKTVRFGLSFSLQWAWHFHAFFNAVKHLWVQKALTLRIKNVHKDFSESSLTLHFPGKIETSLGGGVPHLPVLKPFRLNFHHLQTHLYPTIHSAHLRNAFFMYCVCFFQPRFYT